MNSSFYARTQLRSMALLEPYGESLRHVRCLRSGEPVIPAPSRIQARLEGAIVGSIGYLFDPEQEQVPERKKLEPLRIWVGEREYTLLARPEGLASSLSRVVPLFTSSRDQVENGIPGLRYSDFNSGAGVSFFFPGHPERFNVLGVSRRAFDAYCKENLYDSEHVVPAPGDAPHRQELASPLAPEHELVAVSALARRLGLLINANVQAIDSWWNRSGSFTVELLTSAHLPNPMPSLLSKLQSPHLAPQFLLNEQDSNGYNHFLEVEGASTRIDLRYHCFSSSTPAPTSSFTISGDAPGARTSLAS